MELVFSVTPEEDGGFVAECLSEAIFTQADSWEELKRMVKDAVQTHFFDQPEKAKSTIRLHFVRDEVLSGV